MENEVLDNAIKTHQLTLTKLVHQIFTVMFVKNEIKSCNHLIRLSYLRWNWRKKEEDKVNNPKCQVGQSSEQPLENITKDVVNTCMVSRNSLIKTVNIYKYGINHWNLCLCFSGNCRAWYISSAMTRESCKYIPISVRYTFRLRMYFKEKISN